MQTGLGVRFQTQMRITWCLPIYPVTHLSEYETVTVKFTLLLGRNFPWPGVETSPLLFLVFNELHHWFLCKNLILLWFLRNLPWEMWLSAEFNGLNIRLVNSCYTEMFCRPAAHWMDSALWYLGLIITLIGIFVCPLWLMVLISD